MTREDDVHITFQPFDDKCVYVRTPGRLARGRGFNVSDVSIISISNTTRGIRGNTFLSMGAFSERDIWLTELILYCHVCEVFLGSPFKISTSKLLQTRKRFTCVLIGHGVDVRKEFSTPV